MYYAPQHFPDRLNTLHTRLSAAYKGLNNLIVREEARDFLWEGKIIDLSHDEIALDIHHIFPQAWCQAQNIPAKDYDSVINKTPISYKANRAIGGMLLRFI